MASGVIASTHTDVIIETEKAQYAVLENTFQTREFPHVREEACVK